MFHSIRWSVQIWHGLLLILVLTGFGFTTYQVTWRDQIRRVDAELERRIQMPFRPMRQFGGPPPGARFGPPSGPPFHGLERIDPQQRLVATIQQITPEDSGGAYFVMWDGDGALLARSPAAPHDVPRPTSAPPNWRPEPGAARINGARTRDDTREAYQYLPWRETLLVGRSIEAETAEMRKTALKLAGIGSAVLLFGLAGGWWLASGAIRPIESISRAAVKIAEGDLSQRIDVGAAENELSQVATVLNTTFARLETAFAHQARFTADASHELRTPVSVILAQTQTALFRERSPEEYRETLQACRRAAERMRRLTESLLALTRLDAGQECMKRDRIDLGKVLRDSIEMVRPIADEKRIRVSSDLPVVECEGDAERLGQVAVNLLTNAVQFDKEGGEIRVSAGRNNGGVFFSVADNGEGIPSEDMPHIFERFYRADKARSRAQGQTGLGLAICKAIVDAHRGEITVTSKPHECTEFRVELPNPLA